MFEGNARFRVERTLGQGGMGVVYEAHDRDRDASVALKTLLHLSPAGLLLFKQEFRTAAGIAHTNLVSLYELFSEGQLWFFTMELVEGKTLVEALRSGCRDCEFSSQDLHLSHSAAAALTASTTSAAGLAEPPSGVELPRPDESILHQLIAPGTAPDAAALRDAALQVAKGLLAVHGAGKMHRDIKPSNIVLTPEGRAVVLDFGLAQELDSIHGTRNRFLSGTLAYMPPEQSVAGWLTPAADWYAFGVTLYQALTGILPFGGEPQAMLEAKRKGIFPAPGSLVTGVDPGLESLVLQLLQPEPAQRPPGYDVLARLGAGAPDASPTQASQPASEAALFVGRFPQMQALNAAFVSASQGEAVFVSVHGVSGVGKTALIDHFLQTVRDGTLVLRGRCYEQESVPYKAVDSAIDCLCQHLLSLPSSSLASLLPENMDMLARLFPVLQQLEPASSPADSTVCDPRRARRLAISALRDLLRQLGRTALPHQSLPGADEHQSAQSASAWSESAPSRSHVSRSGQAAPARRRRIVLVIDDLQWGDADSASLIADLLAAPDPPPLLMLCTFRREYQQRSACLQALLPALQANPALQQVEVPVDPLTPLEARDLARHLMAGKDREAVARIAADSGGSPYLVRELAQFVASRPIEPAGGVSLEQAFAQRFATLTPEAQRLLEVICVHGLPLVQLDAFRAAQLGGRSPAPLAALRHGNLIRSTGRAETDEVEPYHDRIREIVVARLEPDALRERHRSLAAALELSGHTDAETLASHFEGAGNHERAGELYEAAAHRAEATLAFARAAAFYQRSLRLRTLDQPAEFHLRRRLAEALANARGGIEAAEAFESAARLAAPQQQVALERRAAFYFLCSGRVEQGRVVLERVMRRVGLRLPKTRPGVLAVLVARTLWLALQSSDFKERPEADISNEVRERIDAAYAMAAPMGMIDGAQGLSFGALCLRLVLRAGDPLRLAYGVQVGGYGMSLQGPRARRRVEKLLDTARRISAERADTRMAATVALAAGSQVYVVGQWRRALEFFTEAELLYSKCSGTHWEIASARILRHYALYSLGEFKTIAQEYGSILEEAEALDDQYSYASIEAFSKPLALTSADRIDDARAAIESGLARWRVEQHGLQQAMAAQALINAALCEGSARHLTAYAQDQWNLLRSSGMARFDNLAIAFQGLVIKVGLSAAGAVESTPAERRAGRQMADRGYRLLLRQTLPWSEAVKSLAAAGMQAHDGNLPRAIELLLRARELYAGFDMRGEEAACGLYVGDLIGGERGEAMQHQARQWFSSQDVVNPDHFARVYLGGILPATVSARL